MKTILKFFLLSLFLFGVTSFAAKEEECPTAEAVRSVQLVDVDKDSHTWSVMGKVNKWYVGISGITADSPLSALSQAKALLPSIPLLDKPWKDSDPNGSETVCHYAYMYPSTADPTIPTFTSPHVWAAREYYEDKEK